MTVYRGGTIQVNVGAPNEFQTLIDLLNDAVADAVAAQTAAATSASNIESFVVEAEGWANTPEDTLVPGGDGIDDYSALHHAAKAAASATAAATSEATVTANLAAAQTAETNAETAATNAQTAETNAELAETNAEAAEIAAELAQAEAEAARDAANAIAGGTAIIATGTTEARSILDRFADVVNVKDFGATADGITDDTAAIQAAIDYAISSETYAVEIPPGGYLVESPIDITAGLVTIIGSGGFHSPRIFTPNDIDVFRVDVTAAARDFCQFRNLTFEYTGASQPTNGSAIRYYNSAGSETFGGSHGVFSNIIIRYFPYGIVFDRTGLNDWLGTASIARYGQLLFENIRIPYNNEWTKVGIWFKGGPGAHNIFSNIFTETTEASIRMGGGGATDGIGDQLFLGIHGLDGEYGLDIIGPSGASIYNENITAVGCHFDGQSVATIRMQGMSNFRLGPNNSTASVGYSLTDCENYFTVDRNHVTFAGGDNPILIDRDGNFTIGTAARQSGPGFTPNNQVHGTSAIGSSWVVYRYSADGSPPIKAFVKSRGASIGTNAAVQHLDQLGMLRYAGDDGTNFVAGADIVAQADGAPSSGSVAARISFATADTGETSATHRVRIGRDGTLRPHADNVYGLGEGSARWTEVFAATGAINTSDEREKQQIEAVPDEWLDAWSEVEFCRYKFNDAVAQKGDQSRWHVGVVAQRVVEAFQRRGLDAFKIGLLCWNEWDDEHEAVLDESGAVVGQRVLIPAGARYGIRYEEALCMEAALMRRELNRLKGGS